MDAPTALSVIIYKVHCRINVSLLAAVAMTTAIPSGVDAQLMSRRNELSGFDICID